MSWEHGLVNRLIEFGFTAEEWTVRQALRIEHHVMASVDQFHAIVRSSVVGTHVPE